MNRELRYALQGTARHTIFEGETWVSDLLADLTEENARHQISQRFDDRFSYTWFGILFQRGREIRAIVVIQQGKSLHVHADSQETIPRSHLG